MDIYGDFSDFYDLYVGDWLEDLPFYLEYAKQVQTPILEVGAGSGRLTIPLARTGASVIAVDSSSSMLAILRSRLDKEPIEVRERIQLVHSDICSLLLEDRHELIVVPFYTFNYFLTPEIQKSALERFAQHLAPQGRVLIDVFLPLSRIQRCPAEPVLKVDTVDAATGNNVRGWNIYSIDKVRQIEIRRHVFKVTGKDGTVLERDFTTQRRYFYPSELESLFADCGFSVEAAFTGYEKKEADDDSEQLLYLLRQKASG
ncbi:MAG: class I SAM-dependent methyltransferase [Planctomycetota bacterium]|nr:MAG: class I SAM-dependent methyltransferase [Planctomycetota bacterium]